MRPPISLGDLTRALGYLEPGDADTRCRIAALLGLRRVAEVETAPPGEIAQAGATEGPPPTGPETPPSPDPPPPPEQPLDDEEIRERPSTLERISGPVSSQRPPRKIPPLDELLEPAPLTFPLAEPSLLNARWRRALLTTALATPTPEGPLDLERIVERIGRGEALDRLPRRPVPTMRQGVQVLIDSREGMRPFARDQQRLADAILDVAGRDLTRVLRFSGCPEHGVGTGTIFDRVPYEPPLNARPVIVLSDLGIGARGICRDRSDVAAWAAFADRVRDAGNPLVAFVPFPPHRWPSPLASRMVLLHWDAATTVHHVRRQTRRSP